MQRAENRSATWDLGADTTLVRLLARNAEVLGDHVAMREKHLGIWQETTWAQMLDATLAFAASLQSMGFGKEDALLVLGDNRPNLYDGHARCGRARRLCHARVP